MNQHLIIGNLVRDPETGTTPAGVGWTRFVVAVRKRFPKEGEPDAEFVRVTAWRGLGENCAKYLAKGKKVAVIGESRASAWISREGTARGQIETTADNVEFLSERHGGGEPGDADAPPERNAEPAGTAAGRAPDSGKQVGYAEVQDEDMPY